MKYTCHHCETSFHYDTGRKFSCHVKWCSKNPNSPKNNKLPCTHCSKLLTNQALNHHEAKCVLNPVNAKFCLGCKKQLETKENIFCDNQCAAIHNNSIRKDFSNNGPPKGYVFPIVTRTCNECAAEFDIHTNVSGKRKFMCIDCCSKYQHTRVTRLICNICSETFTNKNPKKTCSDTCFRKLVSRNSRSNPNCGGTTNYKRYRMDKNKETVANMDR